jgi:hypothetical protein
MRRTCVVFLTIALLGVNARAQNNVGKIIELDGTARLKQLDGKVVTLTEKNFERSLQPNQQLRPDRNAHMRIALCDGTSPVIPAGRWYPVRATIICTAPEDSPIRRILAGSGFGPGGRHRGVESFILFPIESKEATDVVRPETALFRWNSATDARLNLSVSVVGAEQATWARDGISGADGLFSSGDLKAFLQDVREKQPGAELRLTIRSSLNTENVATFRLLPKEKEEAMQRELASLKEENQLLAHLFRADVYRRYDLFNEAAAACEEALKLSPESIELLRETAFLEEQAGDLKRSRELEGYAEQLSNRPN